MSTTRTSMSTTRRGLVAAALAAVLLVPMSPALAGMGSGGGGGGGGSGGGGGGAPVDVYSDLVVALRDEYGRPELLGPYWTTELTGGAPTVVAEYCVQPVSYVPLPGLGDDHKTVNPVDGRDVWRIPLLAETLPPPSDTPPLAADESEDEVEACDPRPEYAMYVTEAELERLNLARTQEDVLARKVDDVAERLMVARELTLDGAGRLVIDGAVVDAGPEHAGMFQSLMTLGAYPGLPTRYLDARGFAEIWPFDASVAGLSEVPMSAEELAAASIGAAASKFAPISVDAVVYYMGNVTGMMTPDTVLFPQLASSDPRPGYPIDEWLDLSGFTYDRAEFFRGGVTWLDVPNMRWTTSPILDVVDFAGLPPIADADGTLHGIIAFAQLVDDIRSAILFFHEYEALVGFHMDPPRVDTLADQAAAIAAPATSWGPMPTTVVLGETFATTVSVFNPRDGRLMTDPSVEVRISRDGGFEAGDEAEITVADTTDPTAPIAIVVQLVGGELVASWTPGGGYDFMLPYSNDTTPLDITIGAGAPDGSYTFTLTFSGTQAGVVISDTDVATVDVLPGLLTARWVSAPAYVEQGTNAHLLARVVNPTADEQAGRVLQLTVTPLGDTLFADGHGSTLYSNAQAIGLTLAGGGVLEGLIPIPTLGSGGAADVAAYLVFGGGAPIGSYELSVEVVARADETVGAPDVIAMYVAEAATHGEQPGAFTITVTPVGTLGSTATFELAASGDTSGVIFQCRLMKDGVLWIEHGDGEEEWTTCTSPKTYTGLPAGAYEFSARGRRGEVLSPEVSVTWTVADPGGGGGTTPPPGGGGGGGAPAPDPTPVPDEPPPAVGGIDVGNADHQALLASLPAAAAADDLSGLVHRLYVAVFGRKADSGGYAYWMARLDAGMPLGHVAWHFASSSEFDSRFGAIGTADFVDLLYRHVLGRDADAGGKAYWVAQLDSGAVSRAWIIVLFADSAELRSAIAAAHAG